MAAPWASALFPQAQTRVLPGLWSLTLHRGTLDNLLMQVHLRVVRLAVLRGTWIYSSLAGGKSLDSNQESHYIPFKTLRLSTNLYQVSECLRLNIQASEAIVFTELIW